MPPSGVKLSCIEFTEPFEVPLVDAAHRPEASVPKRTSLPSMFPPDCAAVTFWLTPSELSSELPWPSSAGAASDITSQITNMMANTARP